MYYVYIIKSIKYPTEFYRGHTADLKKRLVDHNSSSSPHTSKFVPWKLVFYSAFENIKLAINFEKYLKSASGIAFMRKRLLNK